MAAAEHSILGGLRAAAGEIASAACSPTGLAGIALEATWLSAHVATYPVGLIANASMPPRSYRIETKRPHQRGLIISDVVAAGTPILLVHGIWDNRSIFTWLQRGLRSRGFTHVTTLNYSPWTSDLRHAASQLQDVVERLAEETGYDKVHVVGHSLGGLIARYYVTRLGGHHRVHTLVTLGSPHQGSFGAYLLNSSLVRQMRPGSRLMRELDAPVAECSTRFIVYRSDMDEMVLPPSRGVLDHPDLDTTNIELHGVGHASLPILGSVVHGIASSLAHLERDGQAAAGPRSATSA